jgi:RHS repeat-associated protein
MPGRAYNGERYKFGFNGKENDNEVYGDGNFQDYGMRMYDTRVGRFVSVDPLIVKEKKFPWYSPYQFAGNKPIEAIDLDGLEDIEVSQINSENKTAIMTIHYTEIIITSGHGAVNASFISRVKSNFFIDNYQKIWRNQYEVKTKSLPTNGVFELANDEDINNNNYWTIQIKYDVKIEEPRDNYTFQNFLDNYKIGVHTIQEFNGHGAILEPDGSPGFSIPENTWENVGAAGAASVGDWRTWIRPGNVGAVFSGGSYLMIAHEWGHKMGLHHELGDYTQKGLMNNFKVVPTLENTLEIIRTNIDKIR